MKILAAECSAVPCSCALMADGEIIASAFTSEKSTHSKTLLPMIEKMLREAKVNIGDIDGFAISAGPGSFTGVRIGISLIKGLSGDKGCVGLSTLEVIAQNCKDENCVACAVMDARRNQVYNALFRFENGKATRLTEDRAISCEDLAKELKDNYQNKKILISGDGADCFSPFVAELQNIELAEIRYQNAVCVAELAKTVFDAKKDISAKDLSPIYLRLPQAERELKLKKEN